MKYQEVEYSKKDSFELERFKEMDYYAVKHHKLPIELMMENAGLQLANLCANLAKRNQSLLIGVGNGNNGGGGLVAARRLAAWGYEVYLDIPNKITKLLPLKQLERALKFGAKIQTIKNPDLWIDAYFGFSQRLPLPNEILQRVETANNSNAIQISLDIPSGFIGNQRLPHFKAQHILTLAAPKKILFGLDKKLNIYIADIGISHLIYEKFGLKVPPFMEQNILMLKRI